MKTLRIEVHGENGEKVFEERCKALIPENITPWSIYLMIEGLLFNLTQIKQIEKHK